MLKINRISEKVLKTPSAEADPNRYEFLDLSNAEPDLGVPTMDNAISASNTSGERSWINLSSNFEIDSSSNLVITKIEAGTF